MIGAGVVFFRNEVAAESHAHSEERKEIMTHCCASQASAPLPTH